MKISITIDRATVSATVSETFEFWEMVIPCMMAAGYGYDTAFRSLEEFFLCEKQAHTDVVGEDAETWDEEGDDEPETEEPEDDAEESEEKSRGAHYAQGYEDGYNNRAQLTIEPYFGCYWYGVGWRDGCDSRKEHEDVETPDYIHGFNDAIRNQLQVTNLDKSRFEEYSRGYYDGCDVRETWEDNV